MPLPPPVAGDGSGGSRPAGGARAGPGRAPRAAVRGHGGGGARRGVLRRRLAPAAVPGRWRRGVCWWATGRLEPTGGPPAPRAAGGGGAARRGPDGRLPGGRAVARGGLEQITAAVDAPLRDELAAVSARLRLGVDPATVWRDLARPSAARWARAHRVPRGGERRVRRRRDAAAGRRPAPPRPGRRREPGPRGGGEGRAAARGLPAAGLRPGRRGAAGGRARCRSLVRGEPGQFPSTAPRAGRRSPGRRTALGGGPAADESRRDNNRRPPPGGPRRRSP